MAEVWFAVGVLTGMRGAILDVISDQLKPEQKLAKKVLDMHTAKVSQVRNLLDCPNNKWTHAAGLELMEEIKQIMKWDKIFRKAIDENLDLIDENLDSNLIHFGIE